MSTLRHLCLLLAILLLAAPACQRNKAKSAADVPAKAEKQPSEKVERPKSSSGSGVNGKIHILSVGGRELILEGQTIYLIPATKANLAFFETNEEERYLDEKQIKALAGAQSAVIDWLNEFKFAKAGQGSYLIFWQLSQEKAKEINNGFSESHLQKVELVLGKNDLLVERSQKKVKESAKNKAQKTNE